MTFDSLTPAEGKTGRMLREMQADRRTHRIEVGALIALHLVEIVLLIALLLLRR